MAYQTVIQRLFNGDYRYSDRLPDDIATLRNILLYSKPIGVADPSNPISRLLKITYETPFQSYLKVLVDKDVQFDDNASSGFDESFDLMKLSLALTRKEGWLEEDVFMTASDYVPTEVWVPLRERFSQLENPYETVAIATVIFLLVANRVSIDG